MIDEGSGVQGDPPLSEPVGLSIAIITKNAAALLPACLASVRFADQVVVVDSGSSDDTVRIAQDAGAEVLETDWPGFGPQKNRALALCRHRWVLSIDADESLTEELAREIRAIVAQEASSGDAVQTNAAAGYWLERRSAFCGQVMRHGLWANDRVLRLFRRDRARFSEDLVHERAIVTGETATLNGILLHDSVGSFADARGKARFYAALGARGMKARGRQAGLLSSLVHGGWTFVRGYVFKAGFLDGRNGLLLAWVSALGTYWKYRWSIRGAPPD